MATWRRIREEINRNIYHKCNVPGCRSFRYRISKWCRKHTDAYAQWGSPLMTRRYVEKRHYKTERVEVRKFIKRHSEHVGVKAGLSWLEYWLHSGDVNGDKVSQHLVRLRDAGVTPLDILQEIAADAMQYSSAAHIPSRPSTRWSCVRAARSAPGHSLAAKGPDA